MDPSPKLLTVSEAVANRRSCRDFLPKPVPLDLIMKILNEARRAESSSNVQPWKIYLIHGDTKKKLSEILVNKALQSGQILDFPMQFAVHPDVPIPLPQYLAKFKQKWPKYAARYQALGKQVYTSQNVKRGDFKGRMKAVARSFDFWGAPLGLIITTDKQMTIGHYPDIGIMLQTIILLCEQYGLSTCAAVSWSLQHVTLRSVLNINENELIFCGVAIGYQNKEHKVNQFRSERMDLNDMVVIPKIADNYKLPSKTLFKLKLGLAFAWSYLDDYWPYICVGGVAAAGYLIKQYTTTRKSKL